MLIFKMNVVNKKEYEENSDYREIIIRLPRDEEKLVRDFNYLGLDYHSLSIQDTHVINIEVVDYNNQKLNNLTNLINKINETSKNSGYTMPFVDLKKLYEEIKNFEYKDVNKLLAVCEAEKFNINNIKDLIKYTERLDDYNINTDINSFYEYAEYLIDNEMVTLEDVRDYIDFDEFGSNIIDNDDVWITDYGLVELSSYPQKYINNEEEEEFE